MQTDLLVRIKYESRKADAGLKKTTNEMDRFRIATSKMRRQLGAIRNNLLLVTFAFGGIVKAISSIVGVSARFEAVKTRLVGLTGSVKAAEKAFQTFNDVAATTPFQLEDVVNAGAQLQAFGSDAEALIKPITDLAAFMGTTATEAANAFGRAFAGGAGAADILREKGILNIIKTSQGLTDLAKTTLPEFREALIHTLQDPVVGIEGSTDRMSKTFLGAMSNMKDSASRLAARMGDELLPSMVKVAEATRDFLNSISIEDLKETAAAILGIATAYGLYSRAILIAHIRTIKFQLALAKTGWGAVIVGAGLAIGKLIEMSGILGDVGDKFDTMDAKMSQFSKRKFDLLPTDKQNTKVLGILSELRDEFKKGEKGAKKYESAIKSIAWNTAKYGEDSVRAQTLINGAVKNGMIVRKKASKDMETMTDEEKKQTLKAIKEIASAKRIIYEEDLSFAISQIDAQAEHFRQMKLDEVAINEWSEQAKTDAVANHLEKRNVLYNSFMSGYDTFINSLVDMEMTGKERRERVWEATKAGFVQMLGEMLKEKIKALIVQQTVTKASTVAALATNKVTATALASQYAIPASLAATASFGTAAEVGLAGIMASIAATKGVAAFAKGGDFITSGPQMIMVGDNPGGRERVRVDPLSSGASGDSVSNQTVVHIHGGIVDPDYINNTLIPAINSAGERVA